MATVGGNKVIAEVRKRPELEYKYHTLMSSDDIFWNLDYWATDPDDLELVCEVEE